MLPPECPESTKVMEACGKTYLMCNVTHEFCHSSFSKCYPCAECHWDYNNDYCDNCKCYLAIQSGRYNEDTTNTTKGIPVSQVGEGGIENEAIQAVLWVLGALAIVSVITLVFYVKKIHRMKCFIKNKPKAHEDMAMLPMYNQGGENERQPPNNGQICNLEGSDDRIPYQLQNERLPNYQLQNEEVSSSQISSLKQASMGTYTHKGQKVLHPTN